MLVLTGVGCGSASDKIAEKATEKAIEQAGGGNVDINTEDGSVDIKTKDGSMSVGEDGTFEIEGKDGKTKTKISDGEGSELPEEWPSDVALPKGTKITSSMSSQMGEGMLMRVGGEVEGDFDEVNSAFKSQLEEAGYEITNNGVNKSTSGSYGTVTGQNAKFRVAGTISVDSDKEGIVSFMVTVSPARTEE